LTPKIISEGVSKSFSPVISDYSIDTVVRTLLRLTTLTSLGGRQHTDPITRNPSQAVTMATAPAWSGLEGGGAITGLWHESKGEHYFSEGGAKGKTKRERRVATCIKCSTALPLARGENVLTLGDAGEEYTFEFRGSIAISICGEMRAWNSECPSLTSSRSRRKAL